MPPTTLHEALVATATAFAAFTREYSALCLLSLDHPVLLRALQSSLLTFRAALRQLDPFLPRPTLDDLNDLIADSLLLLPQPGPTHHEP